MKIMDFAKSHTGGYFVNSIIMGKEGPSIRESAPGSLCAVNK